MLTFPISPALSACDSLADIDDLYAFLEAQGELSRFPTPPLLKEDFMVEEIEIDLEAEEAELDGMLETKPVSGYC